MAFTESLTVRILGDSSGLKGELDQVVEQLENLGERISSISTGGDQIGRAVGGIAASLQPLQQVSQWISRITQQLQSLSSTPVTLNVQPALQALQQLLNAALAAANAIRLISINPVGPGAVGPVLPPPAPGGNGEPRRFAAGGLVTGPAGLDRVPVMLSAGEFVLSQSAVSDLGLSYLQRLNNGQQTVTSATGAGTNALQRAEPILLSLPQQKPADPGLTTDSSRREASRIPSASQPDFQPTNRPASPSPAYVETSTTNNHFGGINIQVNEAADISQIVRDLRLQGVQLTNRRG